jgi:hypothetical protein
LQSNEPTTYFYIFFRTNEHPQTEKKKEKKRAEGSGHFYAERYVEIILVLSF